jgi:hypothetical protein
MWKMLKRMWKRWTERTPNEVGVVEYEPLLDGEGNPPVVRYWNAKGFFGESKHPALQKPIEQYTIEDMLLYLEEYKRFDSKNHNGKGK